MHKVANLLCRVEKLIFSNRWIRIIFWIFAPLLIYTIPPRLFYEGDSLCLFTRFFGVHCYGCGITRAIFAMLHLDFHLAWEYHRCVVVVVPILIFLWVREIYRLFIGFRDDNISRN